MTGPKGEGGGSDCLWQDFGGPREILKRWVLIRMKRCGGPTAENLKWEFSKVRNFKKQQKISA